MNHTEKIEKNAKTLRVILWILGIVCTAIYSFCIFVYQTRQCATDMIALQAKVSAMETASNAKHKEIDARITQNEKNFQLTSTKLDVSLIEIRSDLQFIKEHLIRKGLDK
jgi:hypothetical protein